uniref:ABC-2 transporter permease n=1 Tax=Parolsenella massiliensis TaxID=1871022 RepID=UPI0009333041|nr:ABC-2 transporter permease [Parolsenella massiliensis]
MKSIIKCEWNTLRTTMPSVVITVALVCAFLVIGGNAVSGMSSGCVMTALLVASSLCGYDDRIGWFRYRSLLPFSRRELVVGRYATVLLVSLATSAALIAIAAFAEAIPGAAGLGLETDSPLTHVYAIVASEGIGLLVVSIALPLYFRYGVMKGVRFVACIGAIVSAVVVGAVSKRVDMGATHAGVAATMAGNAISLSISSDALAPVGVWAESNFCLLMVAFTLASLAIYAASCGLSIKILEKKDL